MSLRIDGLMVSVKALYSRLSLWQRILIVIAIGVLGFVFLGTIGIKRSPPPTELTGFKPYRPERPVVARGESPVWADRLKRVSFRDLLGRGWRSAFLRR